MLFYSFSRKNVFGEKYLYVSHTLFILYLEGNHYLLGEKLYYFLKFSSGNTEYLCGAHYFDICVFRKEVTFIHAVISTPA